jgi:Protein tyrosine and serine/threonine kinase
MEEASRFLLLVLSLLLSLPLLRGALAQGCEGPDQSKCRPSGGQCRTPLKCCTTGTLYASCGGNYACCTGGPCSGCNADWLYNDYRYGSPCGSSPASCGSRCGSPPDGCGGNGRLSCGGCPGDEFCSNYQCTCPTLSCPGALPCGTKSNSCSSKNCGTCPNTDYSCVTNNCVCNPITCLPSENCGNKTNLCGNTVICGSCGADETCNSNQCSCNPVTCSASEICGIKSNACGNNVSCGDCTTGYACHNRDCLPAIVAVVPSGSPCNVSQFNSTSFKTTLAAGYFPVLNITDADVVILSVECTPSGYLVRFAILGTGSGPPVFPPGLGTAGATTFQFPGLTLGVTTGLANSGGASNEDASSDSAGSESSLLWIIIAAAGACALCLIVTLVVVFVRRRQQNSKSWDEGSIVPLDPMDDEIYGNVALTGGTLRTTNPYFVAEQVIGQGNFGRVYRGLNRSDEPCALKELTVSSMTASAIAEMKHEARLLEQCQHRFVVDFFGIIEPGDVRVGSASGPVGKSVFMVMQLAEYGSLLSAIKPKAKLGIVTTASSVAEMARQMASGMVFLDSQGVLHRE